MISKIIAAIGVIKELIALVKMLLGWVEDMRKAKELERQRELDLGLVKAIEAKTPEEAFNAQDDIVKNSN